ncbi:MAG: beta-galactosidase [Arachnia sp.]
MLFGSAYYHEYQPYERLDKDLDLMVEAGFTVIRVGESTWASHEPRDGEIDFGELARVVDAAGERGIRVIVGTPTYAIPAWLARKHPEVMGVNPDGRPVPYGARQNLDYASPVFRPYAERIVRAMGQRFGHHEAVLGFQVDNEIGIQNLANPHLIERFRAHVLDRFGSVEAINERWGLTYWSHRLSTIDDLWGPAGNTNPGYALEWARFQESLTREFIEWQKGILREVVDPSKTLLHCLIGGHSGEHSDTRGISRAMDVAAVNIYVPLQDAFALPEPSTAPGLGPSWLPNRGVTELYFYADMGWSLRGDRGEPFAVTESQATSIAGHSSNIPPFPGQLRLFAHVLLARGANLLSYWHWATLHYGTESYWGGVLGHDLEPGRIYAEVAEIGAELGRIGDAVDGLVPDAEVAVLTDRDSMHTLTFFSPLVKEGTADGDRDAYARIERRFHVAAAKVGAQARIVHLDGDIDQCRVLVVPALYIASDETLARLVALAQAGVHVILTFRSGYADEWACIRHTRAPGPLRAPLGISYQEYANLPEPLRLVGDARVVGEGSAAEGWADRLVVEAYDVEVLASYDSPFLGANPAITSRPVGAGRMTWVGTLPDVDTTASLLAWALDERGVTTVISGWVDAPPQLGLRSGTLPDGRRLWAVANHSWEPITVTPPAGATFLDGGAAAPSITLGPWASELVTEAS